MTYRFTD